MTVAETIELLKGYPNQDAKLLVVSSNPEHSGHLIETTKIKSEYVGKADLKCHDMMDNSTYEKKVYYKKNSGKNKALIIS